jgi:alkylated DNA repair dioxygenase AlkB
VNEGGQLALVSQCCKPARKWMPIVSDAERRSHAFLLRQEDSGIDAATLRGWFERLHPRAHASEETVASDAETLPATGALPSQIAACGCAWTSAQHLGRRLLRQTAWVAFLPECTCEYGYDDTWQKLATDDRFTSLVKSIGRTIESMLGLEEGLFNSCNLNYYPRGGGVGFHADDEYLFDGLERDVTIVSLSLCSENGGSRLFQVKSRDGAKAEQIMLSHGDIMTMEGLFQLFWVHSVYPGDRKDLKDDPLCEGERINLTFRTIVQHLNGSAECRGIKCPLA